MFNLIEVFHFISTFSSSTSSLQQPEPLLPPLRYLAGDIQPSFCSSSSHPPPSTVISFLLISTNTTIFLPLHSRSIRKIFNKHSISSAFCIVLFGFLRFCFSVPSHHPQLLQFLCVLRSSPNRSLSIYPPFLFFFH